MQATAKPLLARGSIPSDWRQKQRVKRAVSSPRGLDRVMPMPTAKPVCLHGVRSQAAEANRPGRCLPPVGDACLLARGSIPTDPGDASLPP